MSKIKNKTKTINIDKLEDWSRKGWVFENAVGSNRCVIRELKEWQKFEIESKYFLEDVGFQHVDGGAKCRIGHPKEVQVDACGGSDSYFLILECKSSTDPGLKDIRTHLKEFSGVKKFLKDGIMQKYPGQYKKIVQILCLKGINVKPKDITLASSLGIKIWHDNYFTEYLEIKELLQDTTKFQVMADLGVRIPKKTNLQVPALRYKLRQKECYSFVIRPDDLLRIAYVFRRGVASSQAYQRALKIPRMRNIKKFLDDKNGFFANSIIISFASKPTFQTLDAFYQKDVLSKKDLQVGMLTLPSEYCSAQVIDGQHRLYGCSNTSKAKHELFLPVTAFHELDPDDQGNLFLVINRKQKRVEANLLWDLLGQMRPDSVEGAISRVVKELDSDSNSPLRNMIYIPVKGGKKKRNQPTIVNLCEEIKRTHIISEKSKDACNLWTNLASTTVDKTTTIISTFFRVVSTQFKKDWDRGLGGFIASGNGMVIMLRILREILILKKGKPTRPDMVAALTPLSSWYNRKKLVYLLDIRRRCSSGGERRIVALDFIKRIHKKHKNKKFGYETLSDAGML